MIINFYNFFVCIAYRTLLQANRSKTATLTTCRLYCKTYENISGRHISQGSFVASSLISELDVILDSKRCYICQKSVCMYVWVCECERFSIMANDAFNGFI